MFPAGWDPNFHTEGFISSNMLDELCEDEHDSVVLL